MPKRLSKGYAYITEKQLYKLSFTYRNKRYSVYGKTQTECADKKNEKIELLKNHMHIDNQKITLSEYYSLWISEQAKEVKSSTIYNYKKSWKHINTHIGNEKLADMTKAEIITMQKAMNKDSCSADTINRATRLLKQILNAAIIDRIISFNPCNGVKKLKTDKPKATETNHRALTTEETATFLEYAAESFYYNLFRFLLSSGCRISEAIALTWFDINFAKSEINISKTVTRISNSEYVISNTPKTEASRRTIPITADIKNLLQEQQQQTLALFGSRSQYVFPNARGKMSNYTYVGTAIKRVIAKINEKGEKYFIPFSVHAFRDTFATRCIEQGMQPHTLKAIMGHSSLKMTMDLYAHVMPNTKQSELEKIQFVI